MRKPPLVGRTGMLQFPGTMRTVILVVALHLAAGGLPPALAAQSESPGFFHRTASDFGRGVVSIGVDAWDVVTFPKDMDRHDALVLAGVLGVGGLMYANDADLFEKIRQGEGNGFHDGLRDVGDFFEPLGLMGNTNAYYALGIAVGYFARWEPLEHVARDLLVSHWLSAATYNPPRDWLGRTRPNTGLGARDFSGGTSMPSGHASTIVQLAAVLSHHIDRRPVSVALYALAGTVLFQRVDSEAHWPSDVWVGAAWGWGVAKIVLRNAGARRAGDGRGLQVVSVLGPAGSGVALHLPLRLR